MEQLENVRKCVDNVGATWHELNGDDAAKAIVDFAGHTRSPRSSSARVGAPAGKSCFAARSSRLCCAMPRQDEIDVHVIACEKPHELAEAEEEG